MICFDLEGPLSPQDNAYEVMKLSPNGGAVFEALSGYDDILALRERPGYEPGDTLKLIVPFLVYYGITESDIRGVSATAKLVEGMKEMVDWLRERGMPLRIISTSYQQHAHTIGERLGVPEVDIASTRLALEEIDIAPSVMAHLKNVEAMILTEGLSKAAIDVLEDIYFSSGLFERIPVEVVGGQRKVDALVSFAKKANLEISDVIAVGDSITDYKMLDVVRKGGGLAIAFNANKYCLPYADVAVASVDGRDMKPVIEGFLDGGKQGALRAVEGLRKDQGMCEELPERERGHDLMPHFSTPGRDSLDEVLKVHKTMRMRVRGEAGRLG